MSATHHVTTLPVLCATRSTKHHAVFCLFCVSFDACHAPYDNSPIKEQQAPLMQIKEQQAALMQQVADAEEQLRSAAPIQVIMVMSKMIKMMPILAIAKVNFRGRIQPCRQQATVRSMQQQQHH
eukprot:1151218-Pelagomonas_calceolata.AAC.1